MDWRAAELAQVERKRNVSENTGGLAVGFSAFLPVGAVGSQFCKATARDKLGSS